MPLKKAYQEMRSGISYGVRAILLENIPATIFMVVMADPIVRTVYMGKKFLPSDVLLTTTAFIFYSAGVFAWAGQAIVARGFFALQDTMTPILIGTICTVIFIPLNYFLMKVMGTGGLALSTSIAVTLHFVALIFALRKRLNGIEGRRILKSATKVLIAALIMGVVCIGVRFGMSRIVGTWQLQIGDVKNPAIFYSAIKSSTDTESRNILSHLSQQTIALSKQKDTSIHGSKFEKSFLHDINTVINSPSQTAAHNRKLLESQYPEHIVKRSMFRVESKMGSLLTVLAAMFIGGIVYFGLLKLMKSEEVDEVLGMIKRKGFEETSLEGIYYEPKMCSYRSWWLYR